MSSLFAGLEVKSLNTVTNRVMLQDIEMDTKMEIGIMADTEAADGMEVTMDIMLGPMILGTLAITDITIIGIVHVVAGT
jgi:hypothetical protein